MAENLEFLTICFECRAIKQGDNWLAPTTQEYQEIMRKYNREDRMTRIQTSFLRLYVNPA